MGYRGGLNVTQVNPKRGAELRRTVSQSIPDDAGFHVIAFNTEQEDTSNYHAPGASSLVVPAGLAGFYIVTADVRFNTNAVGIREMQIRRNGAQVGGCLTDNAGGTNSWGGSAAVALALVPGDELTVAVRQTSGGALGTGQCVLAAYRIAA